MNGGMLRCFHLLHQLSKYFDVTSIIKQNKDAFLVAKKHYHSLSTIDVYSIEESGYYKDVFSFLPLNLGSSIRYRWLKKQLSGPANSIYLDFYRIIHRTLQDKVFDYVIMENLALLDLSSLILKLNNNAIIIYDAHNVDSILADDNLRKNLISARSAELTKRSESRIHLNAHSIFACSKIDLNLLKKLNENKINGYVVPNGTEIPPYSPKNYHESRNILFCGSMDYQPNQEGLIWFIMNIFQIILFEIPDVKLYIVGKGNPGTELARILKHPSIVNVGMVDKVDMYYSKATVAIIPLLSGSGTRLKLLEAMAHRVPVVSTSVGAEGISWEDGKSILIANDAKLFAKKVSNLLNNSYLAESISASALALTKSKYDWNIIGRKMASYLKELK